MPYLHQAHELLTTNFKQWVLHFKNPHVLPPSSEKFIKELGFTVMVKVDDDDIEI